MAQVPMRMPQPGLVPPHQQRPPMMVSMTQQPPPSMQGLVSMATMMAPAGGMAVMTQAMSHPDSHEHINAPYHHHPPHPHHGPPRPHGPHPGPPHHHSGPPQPHHSGPHHSQYHPPPHPPGPHLHQSGPPHSGMHGGMHGGSHANNAPLHSGPHSGLHGSSHINSMGLPHSNTNTHINNPSGSHFSSSTSHSMPHMPPSNVSHSGSHSGHHAGHQHPNMLSGSHSSPHTISGPYTNSQACHHMGPPHAAIPSGSHTGPPSMHSMNSSHLNNAMNSGNPSVSCSVPNIGNIQSIHHMSQPHQVSGVGVSTANMHQQQVNMHSSSMTPLHMPPSGGVCPQLTSNSNHPVDSGPSIVSSGSGACPTSINLSNGSDIDAFMQIKEKTPMCLVNELARHNKIKHQYCLTDEKGPAHKKTFVVTLHLGPSEQYVASGPSIKKAQHATASIALAKTEYKHPPPKTTKQNKPSKLTPAVELNALAMKRGETAVYTFMESGPHYPYPYNLPPDYRSTCNQRYFGRPPTVPVFFVSLRVGSQKFVGDGYTAQQAKHSAAVKALKVVKALPMPDSSSSSSQGIYYTSEVDSNSEFKSPISIVHETALKRNLTVNFEVVRESGPPHMRTFVTICTVGELHTQGEGAGKKVSKKEAAELMVEELKKLPSLPAATLVRVKRKPAIKKKSKNLIKEQKAAPEYGQGINPISRLIQFQQAKKEKEPVYSLVAERGVPRRREFVMQVTVGNQVAQGSGPNKKLAKRTAAENMLQQLGYSRPQPQPGKPAIKTDGSHSDHDKPRKVTFMEDTEESHHYKNEESHIGIIQSCNVSGAGRQLVPGLIMMGNGSGLHGYQQQQIDMGQMVNLQQTAAIAKELLKSGNSPTAEAMVKHKPGSGNGNSNNSNEVINQEATGQNTPANVVPVQHRQQSQRQFQPAHSSLQSQSSIQQNLQSQQQPSTQSHPPTPVNKGNKSEYLSLVSLSTVPPHLSHGAGPTTEASHDQACLTTLMALAEMGLDTVTANAKEKCNSDGT